MWRTERGVTMQLSNKHPSQRVSRICFGSILLFLFLASIGAKAATDGPAGITEPKVFAQFDSHAPSCQAPPGLEHALAFAQDNEREFMQGVNRGLALAAKDRNLKFSTALAANDPAKM